MYWASRKLVIIHCQTKEVSNLLILTNVSSSIEQYFCWMMNKGKGQIPSFSRQKWPWLTLCTLSQKQEISPISPEEQCCVNWLTYWILNIHFCSHLSKLKYDVRNFFLPFFSYSSFFNTPNFKYGFVHYHFLVQQLH